MQKGKKLKTLNAITAKSRLTEKDAIEIGRKIRKGIAKRHGNVYASSR